MKFDNAFDRNNAASVFLMGALPTMAGSAISFLLGAFFAWGLASLLLGRFPFRLTRLDRALAWTFTVFAGLVLLTALLGENRWSVPRQTYWLLPFLSIWVVVPRLRASRGIDYLGLYIAGAAVGAVGGLAVGLVQVLVFDLRPEGGAGNAAVYAIMSLCLAAIAGLGIANPDRRLRLLAAAGVAAGLVAVVLSLTRGVAVVAVLVMVLLLVYAPQIWRQRSTRLAGLALAFAGAAALYGASDLISMRVAQTVEEFALVIAGESSANVGERLRLWEAGWQAVAESPIWGHGIQNRMTTVARFLIEDGHPVRNFTHAHNAFITFAVDGGLVVLAALVAVLAAPVAVAWRALRDENHRRRLFLALQVSVIYAACGMTQIMFKHDIMDAFFVFAAILVAVSVPDPDERERAAQP